MNKLIYTSLFIFIISIISFYIKNGNKKLTFKQIIQLSGHNLKSHTFFENYPDILLMFSIVSLILSFDYPFLIEILGGVFVVFVQKIIILILLWAFPKN